VSMNVWEQKSLIILYNLTPTVTEAMSLAIPSVKHRYSLFPDWFFSPYNTTLQQKDEYFEDFITRNMFTGYCSIILYSCN
jgi:hypothetical protein